MKYRPLVLVWILVSCWGCVSLKTTPTASEIKQQELQTLTTSHPLSSAQLQTFQGRLQSLVDQKHVPSHLALAEESTTLEVFYAAHSVANHLYATRQILAGQDWLRFLKSQVFFTPEMVRSFDLISLLLNWQQLGRLQPISDFVMSQTLDFRFTRFQTAEFFMHDLFGALVSQAYLPASLKVLDHLFGVYGSVPTLFHEVQTYEHKTGLALELAKADPAQYQSKPLKGLIYANKIKNLHSQGESDLALRMGEGFIKAFADHPRAYEIQSLLRNLQRGVQGVRPITIAVMLPLTGPYAEVGEQILKGLYLAFGYFQEEALLESLAPTHPSLILVDTHKHQSDLFTYVSSLIERESIQVMVGPLLSQTHPTVVSLAQKFQIPLLSLAPQLNGNENVPAHLSYVFQMRPSPTHQLSFMVDYLNRRLPPYNGIGILYPDNPFGRFQASSLQSVINLNPKLALKAAGLYTPKDTKSFKNTVMKLLGLFDTLDRQEEKKRWVQQFEQTHGRKPEDNEVELPPIVDFKVLFLPTPVTDASIFIPMFKYFNANRFIILGNELWQNQDLITRTGPYLKHVILYDIFFRDTGSPPFTALMRRFESGFEEPFSSYSYLGYLTGSILGESLQRTKGDISARKIVESLLASKGETPLGQNWFFTQMGNFNLDPIPIGVISKQFVRLTDEMIEELQVDVFSE
jgi:hypothetical protein